MMASLRVTSVSRSSLSFLRVAFSSLLIVLGAMALNFASVSVKIFSLGPINSCPLLGQDVFVFHLVG